MKTLRERPAPLVRRGVDEDQRSRGAEDAGYVVSALEDFAVGVLVLLLLVRLSGLSGLSGWI